MAQINLKALANQSFNKSTIYVAIVEAIVNAINAIEDKWNLTNWWEVHIKFLRENQKSLSLWKWNEVIPNVVWIEISDNWIWFNDVNKESFSTVYSDYKKSRWWLWFGRISYLKFFDDIRFFSKYEEHNVIMERSWKFTSSDEFEGLDEKNSSWNTWTVLRLSQIKQRYINTIDKNFEVIVRRISEKLLWYYAFNAELPKIIFHDSLDAKSNVSFQDFLLRTEKIIKFVDCEPITIWGENFLMSFIKVYNTQLGNAINICAHNREIIECPMWDVEKLLQDCFIDLDEKKYSVLVYVSWDYFNNNVNSERDGFNLPLNSSEQWLYPEFSVSIEDVLQILWNKLRNYLKADYEIRQKRRQEIIDKYFEDNPMYSEYRDLLDSIKWWVSLKQEDIALEVAKIEIDKKQTIYDKFEKVKSGTIIEDDAINEILWDISDFNKIELAKYKCGITFTII